jgi:adenosylcobinamide-GDP ribazoletransferase
MLLKPWCGAPLAALFAVLALALLTGGHLDGVADTCDGVFSARTRERMLEIARQPSGTHGGLALVFVLVAKMLVISELSLRGLAACGVGRGLCRRARLRGGDDVWSSLRPRRAGQFVYRQGHFHADRYHAGACAAGGGGAGRARGDGVLITVLAIFLLGLMLKRTLGGQTGDTLGAAIELGELVFLLALL